MEHSFDIAVAEKFGVHSAILFKHIYFWVTKNKANEKNFYDGNYWTYCSNKAFTELFPYFTSRQIDYALQKLIDEEVIITGNYNKNPYDRTLWYALTEKGYSILQNCQMKTTEMSNENDKNVEPIPDINTYIEKDTKNIVGATDVTPTLPPKEIQPTFYNPKEDTVVLEDGTPLPPQTPPSPIENVIDKVEKKTRKSNRKSKQEKTEEWLNKTMVAIEVYGFSDQLKEKLEKYFNYLANFGTLLPWESLELQMNKLASVPRRKQIEIIDETIARGWKSIVYVIDDVNRKAEQQQKKPSYRIDGGENHRSKEERQAWFDKYKDVKLEE